MLLMIKRKWSAGVEREREVSQTRDLFLHTPPTLPCYSNQTWIQTKQEEVDARTGGLTLSKSKKQPNNKWFLLWAVCR